MRTFMTLAVLFGSVDNKGNRMKFQNLILSVIVVCTATIAKSTAGTIDFTGLNLAEVSSAFGEDFVYPSGTLNVRMLSGVGPYAVVPGDLPDAKGFYSRENSSNLTPALYRFTFNKPLTFRIDENETLTTLETNTFTLPSGYWTILSSAASTVSGGGAKIAFTGITNAPPSVAYSIQGTGASFDFLVSNASGFPEYGSSISVNFNGNTIPEPSTLALLGVGIIGLISYEWRRRWLRSDRQLQV